MAFTFDETDTLCINTIRTLSMDAVQRANSGHPGAPMGLAPVAHVLFTRFLKHDSDHPQWEDRDRFVLSCGHASMLLYSLLHLSGYDLSLDDLKSFRQWGSKTPGHPERDPEIGVEMTTGPLGQGCATAVGLAFAEAHLAAEFNNPAQEIVDHMTWVLCGDGDLMEGLSAEAAGLAAHLGLGKLVWIWDDNRITIEGGTDLATSEDMLRRFEGHGWHVQQVADANDLDAVAAALENARSTDDRPSLVAVRSNIAYGAPGKQDTSGAHGAPLGEEEIHGAKAAYGWPTDEAFFVPDAARERYARELQSGRQRYSEWQELVAAWSTAHSDLGAEWHRRMNGDLRDGWTAALPTFPADAKGMATRAASGKVLNAIEGVLPELIGGSADLSPSCKTTITSSGSVTAATPGERNLHFGVREHGMGAMLNGMVLHGGVRPYGATFLVFSDYMRPAIRLAALMEQPTIFIFTHDSIWVGEDGPTHQPVEHVAALRAIPNLVVLRPADANETAAAWREAVCRNDGPTAIVLSRHGLPVLEDTATLATVGLSRGAYVLVETDTGEADLVIVASGSEVCLAVDAARSLRERDLAVRVVSMPSWELFDTQPEAYRRDVLPPMVAKLAVEAGITRGWRDYVGSDGEVIGIDRFGASAPGKEVAARLGLTVDAVIDRALELMDRRKQGDPS